MLTSLGLQANPGVIFALVYAVQANRCRVRARGGGNGGGCGCIKRSLHPNLPVAAHCSYVGLTATEQINEESAFQSCDVSKSLLYNQTLLLFLRDLCERSQPRSTRL
jgi:hypothetical protein